jgi:Sulfatase
VPKSLVSKSLVSVLGSLLAVVAVLAVAACSSGGGDDQTATAAAAKPLVAADARPAKVPKRPPVVLMIFDEFPGDTLLDAHNRIDPVRFPNLARLAATGSWFPNATTYYDSTPKAVPQILDGQRPRRGTSADRGGHPRSIYDLLGRKGYRIVNSEEATALCPRRYCRNARRTRPGIVRNIRTDRNARFTRWASHIKRTRAPTAYIKHTLLPHVPWEYLPSGARTRVSANDPIRRMSGPPGFGDRFLTQHNYQRFLLQASYTDREVGKVIARLKLAGSFDQALIVITADHGIALTKVGVQDRRSVNQANVDEVGPVPMIIKAPGQRGGKVERQYIRTVDVTPTIADILDFRLPYRAFGHSGFSRVTKRRRTISLPNRSFTRTIRISGKRYEARRRAQVRRRLRWFGSGPFASLYTGIGPNRKLVGRTVAQLKPGKVGKVRAAFAGRGRVHNVRRRTGVVPTQLAGILRHDKRGVHRDVAVAVNGRIEAVGRTFYVKGSRSQYFAAMVPEPSLREGNNSIAVYSVRRGSRLRLLGNG